METQLYTTELLLTLVNNTTTIIEKLDTIENIISDVKPTKNDFNIATFKKASKITKCSITALRNGIKRYKCNECSCKFSSKRRLKNLQNAH